MKTTLKNYITFCAIVASWFIGNNLSATNIWSGSFEIGNWNYQVIEASSFASTQVGDTITFGVSNIGDAANYPQISLKTQLDGWRQLSGAGNTNLSSQSSVSYIVTKDMLSDLNQGGIVVSGCYYTLTSVDLASGNGGAGYENAVWIGNTVIGNWDNSVIVPHVCFKNAKSGDLLRIKIKDLGASATGHLQYINSAWTWTELPDATDFVALSGSYFQFTITDNMLPILKGTNNENGIIIGGCNFTVTAVEIIDPASLLTLDASTQLYHNWVWSDSETPKVILNINNSNNADVNANISITIKTDKAENVATITKSVNVAKLSKLSPEIEISEPLSAGIYNCTVLVNDDLAGSFNFAINPEQIVAPVDAQPDFSSFWNKAKSDLAAVEPDYKLTEITSKSSSKRKVYLVEMKSVGDETGSDVTIRGYYAEPVAAGLHPAIIHYQGYDSSADATPWCMNGDDNPDYCELILSCRGQWINNRAPYSNPYGDWFVSGFDSKDHYYYRGAFMDCVRGIDFIASREKVQKEDIFAEGSSQGGAFTIAAAALDSRLKAIAPSIQFLGDFPNYFKVGSWPAYPAENKRAELNMSEDDMYTMLSYFDTKNLAPYITCPVITTIGLQDNVCPPRTNLAPFNNLSQVASENKVYSINPTLLHQVPDSWYNTYINFFMKYSTTTEIENIAKDLIKFAYTVKNNTVELSNLNIGSKINIYNIAGYCVSSETAKATSTDIEVPTSGVYIINVDNQSAKVFVK